MLSQLRASVMLTHIQGLVLAAGVSMIVSAPTSSGKTLVGEIVIFSALRANRREEITAML